MFGKGRLRTLCVAFTGLCCLAAAAASQAAIAGGGGVLKVRLGGDQTETRIVIDLDKAATGKVASAGEDGRVVMNLSGVAVDGTLQGGGQGLVRGWVMDGAPGGVRLRVDLAADATIKRRFLLPPAEGVTTYRYVIDLTARGAVPVRAPAVASGNVTLTSTTSARPRPTPLMLKKVIVIDAGHGGKDPGAAGANVEEKDVTLGAAMALKARLERTGRYKVVMTRSSDVYVPLESRVQIARRADADLFISLHADSGPNTTLRGASVYTLSDRATGRAAKFVNKDDWFMQASLNGDHGVSDILLDLTQRATRNRSANFAEMLLERVGDQQVLLRRSHRDAGLVVLLAPDVPAVLLEMGFITNPQDESLLHSQQRRTRLMSAVGDSIDDYFNQQTRLASR